jgi:hypothetical protein
VESEGSGHGPALLSSPSSGEAGDWPNRITSGEGVGAGTLEVVVSVSSRQQYGPVAAGLSCLSGQSSFWFGLANWTWPG